MLNGKRERAGERRAAPTGGVAGAGAASAGRHLLLTEDLVALLRGAGWGGGKSRQGRQRGARRERKRWELDEGDDGCFGEHHGACGFDHPPWDDFLYGEDDGF